MKFIRSRVAVTLAICLCALLMVMVPKGEVRAACENGKHSFIIVFSQYEKDPNDPTNPEKNYAVVEIRCDNCSIIAKGMEKVSGECIVQTPDRCGAWYTTYLSITYPDFNRETGALLGNKTYKVGSQVLEENGEIKVLEHSYEGSQVTYAADLDAESYLYNLDNYEWLKEYYEEKGQTFPAEEIPDLMNNSSVSYTAERKCQNNNCSNSQKDTLKNVNAALVSLTKPTCVSDGSATIEYSADLNGFTEEWAKADRTETGRKTFTLTKLGHSFLHYKRDANGTTMTATCAREGCSATKTRKLDDRIAEDPDEESLSPFIQPDAYPDDEGENAAETAVTVETDHTETETAEAETAPKTGDSGNHAWVLGVLALCAMVTAGNKARVG